MVIFIIYVGKPKLEGVNIHIALNHYLGFAREREQLGINALGETFVFRYF